MIPGGQRRLFFALWPDASTAASFRALARRFEPAAGRTPPVEDLHVTLCFLGSVQEALLPALTQCAAAIAAPGFELEFDRLEYWRRPRVLAVTCARVPPALHTLVGRLSDCARLVGTAPETRPYQPHVTLLRGVAAAPSGLKSGTPLVPPLELRAREFHLTQSQSLEPQSASGTATVRYRRLQVWPLLEPDPAAGG